MQEAGLKAGSRAEVRRGEKAARTARVAAARVMEMESRVVLSVRVVVAVNVGRELRGGGRAAAMEVEAEAER